MTRDRLALTGEESGIAAVLSQRRLLSVDFVRALPGHVALFSLQALRVRYRLDVGKGDCRAL